MNNEVASLMKNESLRQLCSRRLKSDVLIFHYSFFIIHFSLPHHPLASALYGGKRPVAVQFRSPPQLNQTPFGNTKIIEF